MRILATPTPTRCPALPDVPARMLSGVSAFRVSAMPRGGPWRQV